MILPGFTSSHLLSSGGPSPFSGDPWDPSILYQSFWGDVSYSGGLLDGSGGSISDGETVGTFVDRMGLRNVTQATDSARPIYDADGGPTGGPCIVTGSTDYLTWASSPHINLSNWGGNTIFVVAEAPAIASPIVGILIVGPNGCLGWYIRSDSGGYQATTNQGVVTLINDTTTDFPAGYNLFMNEWNIVSTRQWTNGVNTASFVGNANLSQSYTQLFGSSIHSQWFGGKLTDCHVVAGKCNIGMRQALEGYLAHKRGLTGRLASDHPYKLSAPTTAINPTSSPTSFSNSSDGVAASGGNPITIPGRADAQADDILILALSAENPFTHGSSPSGTGWTYLGRHSHTLSPTGITLDLWWKRATGAEGDITHTFTTSVPNRCIGKIFVFRGCAKTGNPIDNEGGPHLSNANVGTGVNYQTANVPAIGPHRLMVNIIAQDNSGQTGNSNNSWSKDFQQNHPTSGAGGISLHLFTKSESTAGLKTGNQYQNVNLAFTASWSFALIPNGYNSVYFV